MSFSFAKGSASRKVCIGVLPKHQRPWCGRRSTALEDAGLEPPLDQAEDSWVSDPAPQHPNQPPVVDGVEEGSDVEIEHPVHALRGLGQYCPLWTRSCRC